MMIILLVPFLSLGFYSRGTRVVADMKYSTEEVRMQLIGYVKAHDGSIEDAAKRLGCNVGNLEGMMAGDAPIDDMTANRLGLRLVHHFESLGALHWNAK